MRGSRRLILNILEGQKDRVKRKGRPRINLMNDIKKKRMKEMLKIDNTGRQL